MKVNNILTMMGSGVVLGLTGGILIISSAALGLTAAFPQLPQWAGFLIIGVVAAGIGGFLLSRSGTETAKKVEDVERKLTLQEAWERKPWLMLGISVAAGFVAQRILRSAFTSDSVKVKMPENSFEAERLYEEEKQEQHEKGQKHSSFKAFLLRPLNDLARHATSRALALGAQMVVTPFLMKKLQEFIDQHQMNFAQQRHEPEAGPDGQRRDDFSQPHQANGNRRF